MVRRNATEAETRKIDPHKKGLSEAEACKFGCAADENSRRDPVRATLKM